MHTVLIVIVSILIGMMSLMTYNAFREKPLSDQKTTKETKEIKKITLPTGKIIEETIITPSVSSSSSNDENNSSWQKYTSIPLGFSINHPADVLPQKQGEKIVFSKWGPSQIEGSEFFDGISLSFSAGNYTSGFDDAVNRKLQEVKDGPAYVTSSKIQTETIANHDARSFETLTMGKSRYLYIDKGHGEYLEIIDSTVDPSHQGFTTTVSQMLDSLQIL